MRVCYRINLKSDCCFFHLIPQSPQCESPLLLPHVTVTENNAVGIRTIFWRCKKSCHDGLQIFWTTSESVILESSKKTESLLNIVKQWSRSLWTFLFYLGKKGDFEGFFRTTLNLGFIFAKIFSKSIKKQFFFEGQLPKKWDFTIAKADYETCFFKSLLIHSKVLREQRNCVYLTIALHWHH